MQEVINFLRELFNCLMWGTGAFILLYIDYVVVKQWKNINKK